MISIDGLTVHMLDQHISFESWKRESNGDRPSLFLHGPRFRDSSRLRFDPPDPDAIDPDPIIERPKCVCGVTLKALW